MATDGDQHTHNVLLKPIYMQPGDNQLVLGCSPNFSGKGNTLKQIQEKTEQYTDLDRRLAVYIRFASPP
ncbi:TPA: hypothetical protein EYN98_16280 [Candidatus Poribacteria bacterium]|nr:hypothetical protein [Candidatus Poribacteria bacterium]HIA67579.1 hypothetical protein [Candidatus Poribacteria bacterium]HIB89770.1 hypothetical protein [Candidatus Poribacteria bacterium]HIB99100.1 hypothetical protein [Candidatus Poribacteria bacterium]HIN29540.1 hypothetical protein [Candidatus Poribacteria bacterium]